MIKTRENLRQVLKLERLNYLPKGTIFPWIVNSKNYRIYQFQKYLRKEEFYGNNLFSWLNKVLWVWNKKRKNTLGQRLGFDIPMNCFGEGLWIHHVGPVTINGDARIGKNCIIAGNVCIGSNGGGVPTIGNNCKIGYGAIIIGEIDLADDVVVGAGAVVTKSCNEKAILAGIPAERLYV